MKTSIGEKKNRKSLYIVLMLIFLFMLLLNILTHFYADDYTYMNSFATGERISSIGDIFKSLVSHAKNMNGRLVAHFFVQLFLFLPVAVFKIINPLIFVLQIFIVVRLCGKNKNDPLFFVLSFAFIWIFEPAFGQVNLWLDGSCNYLWASVFALLFLYPFADLFMNGKNIKNPFVAVFFVILGFLTGAFSENVSSAVIFMAFLFIILTAFMKKHKISFIYIASFVCSLLGFLFMLLQPAERAGKVSDFSLGTLRINFISVLNILKSFWLLIMLFVVLAVIAFYKNISKDKIILSVILALGALFSSFILIFAEYVPERCMAFAVVLFTAATINILKELFDSDLYIFARCISAVILTAMIYFVFIGTNDIYSSYCFSKENNETIEKCKENDILDVEIPVFTPYTKYSPSYGLKYLDTEDTDTWPNSSMAAYFGVKSIKGYYE